jgi:type III secretion protein Q
MEPSLETAQREEAQALQERLRVLVSPPVFPILNPKDLLENNVLSRCRMPAVTDSGAGKLSLWPLPPYLLHQWQGSWVRIEMVIADRLALVHIPIDIITRVAKERFPDLPFDGLEPRLRAIILEYIFAPTLESLEKIFQAPVRLGEVLCPVPLKEPIDFTFSLSFDGSKTFPMAVSGSRIDKTNLSLLINNMLPDRYVPKNLIVPVSFRAGYATFSVTEIQELDVGAGIILDGTYIHYNKVVAVTGEQFVQTCTWQNLRPILDGTLLRYADKETRFFTMEADVSSGTSDESSPLVGTVKDVLVHLVFEIGRVQLSVNEIETLGQGYVFDLGRPLGQEVKILSGGRMIGVGELVRIADSIGVRVLQITKEKEAAHGRPPLAIT